MLYAPCHQHYQFRRRASSRPRGPLRHRLNCPSVCDERLGDAFDDLAQHLLYSIERPIDFRFLDNEWWRQANGVPVSCLGKDSDAQQPLDDDAGIDLLRIEFYAGEKSAAAHF